VEDDVDDDNKPVWPAWAVDGLSDDDNKPVRLAVVDNYDDNYVDNYVDSYVDHQPMRLANLGCR
jgi:hypothetical protein